MQPARKQTIHLPPNDRDKSKSILDDEDGGTATFSSCFEGRFEEDDELLSVAIAPTLLVVDCCAAAPLAFDERLPSVLFSPLLATPMPLLDLENDSVITFFSSPCTAEEVLVRNDCCCC